MSKAANIKTLFANKKARNVIIITVLIVLSVFALAIAIVGKRKDGPPIPKDNIGAKVEQVQMVQERQRGEMDPTYRARFEQQNKAQADSAEKDGGSAMVRIADDVIPRDQIDRDQAKKVEDEGLKMSRAPSGTQQAGGSQLTRGGSGRNGEPQPAHPAITSLISLMRPVAHQTHIALASPEEVAPVSQTKGGIANITEKVDIGEVFYNAGDIAAATVTNTMNSDVPGVALATIHTGKLAGSKLIGTYASAANGTGITANYTKLATADGKVFAIQAKALTEGELSSLLASSTDHKYMNRFVIRPLAYFAKGMSQAIQTSLGASNTTYNDSSRITTINQNKATTEEQAKIAAGVLGEAVISEIEKPQNMTPTTIVARNEVFALVFLDRVSKINSN